MATQLIQSSEFFDDEQSTNQSPKAKRRKERKQKKMERTLSRTPKPLEPRTANQALYIEAIQENGLTFGVGPAGTGKTYVPSRIFGEMLMTGAIKKLYLARPNVSKSKHRNGFLPGTEEEKTAPWLVPIFEGLKDAMGKNAFEAMRKSEAIEIVPYEFIQGRTFKDNYGAACIVDEAENLDLDDLYITLTRQGENLSMVLCGDIYQARIHDSGLKQCVDMVEQFDMEDTAVVAFTHNDVVRSAQAAQWVKAFEKVRNLPTDVDYGKSRSFTPETTPTFLARN